MFDGLSVKMMSAGLATGNDASEAGVRRIALIGNYLPRKCGIATFTSDVFTALRTRYPDVAIDVWAMDDEPGAYAYPPEVTGTIDQDDRISYSAAAQAIEASGADLVLLQHEYGIFGGSAGEHILHLLDQTTLPVVTHIHTTLSKPDDDQRRVLERVVRRSARLIVMADEGKRLLAEVYGAEPGRIDVIPHGVPDRPFRKPAAMKARLGFGDRPVVLTFGLLSPGKGIETVIAAMPAVAAAIPDALYVVLGATHPHLVAQQGEAYREKLTAQAAELGVGDNVRFIDGFVEYEELLDYLEAADIYATPYLNAAQVTSGTLAYAIGLGKAVVSTPYVHAREILADNHGCLVDFGDSVGFGRAISALLADQDRLCDLRKRAYERGRAMIWPRFAEAAMHNFEVAIDKPAAAAARTSKPVKSGRVGWAGVERMTDGVGMYQHSILSVPDRAHGYCVDDNARALMFAVRADLPAELRAQWTATYAAFVDHSWNNDDQVFRNFMSYDRRWLEPRGSDDSNGRCIWTLGIVAQYGDAEIRRWALSRFDRAMALAETLHCPRASAFAMLGAAARLEVEPEHARSRNLIAERGKVLCELLDEHRRPDWAWFEIVLAYDNCRLPEALIRGGRAIGDSDMVQTGLTTLDWICTKQTTRSGKFRPIGHESFGRAYAEPLPFDQQPVEAWATIDACAAAFAASGNGVWRKRARAAWRWFLGDNDHGVPLADPATGDCFDGLTPQGVNLNRGAESVLAFQLGAIGMRAIGGILDDQRDLRLAVA